MRLQFGRNGAGEPRGELRSGFSTIRPGNYPPSISNSSVPYPGRPGVMGSLPATRQHPQEYGQQVVEIAAVAAPVWQPAALGCHQHTLTVDEWKIVGQVPATIPFLSCHVFHRCRPGVSLGGAIIIGSRGSMESPCQRIARADGVGARRTIGVRFRQ